MPSAYLTLADHDASTDIIKTQPSSELLVDHANTLPVFACRRLEKRCSLFQGQKSTEQIFEGGLDGLGQPLVTKGGALWR